MATTSSLFGGSPLKNKKQSSLLNNMCQPNNLFDHDDAEELSIDLNDGADFGHNDNFAPHFSHPQQT